MSRTRDQSQGIVDYVSPSLGAYGLVGRNVIVNGDSSIAQINGANAVTPSISGTFPIDMRYWGLTQPSKLSAQQVTNKLNSLGATHALQATVVASYTTIATDLFFFYPAIEGYNLARFAYGTANAKAGSLQFKVNASVAGTYSGAIISYNSTRSYPFTYTVAANTDTLIQIQNIPGDTGGTWVGATSASAGIIIFDMGSGSTFKSSTVGSWQAGAIYGVTGSTNLVSQTNGSTLTITDIQFEVGSVCTQFERKLYDQNLRECQRYLPCWNGTFTGIVTYSTTTTNASMYINYPTTTRVPATGIVFSSVSHFRYNNASSNYIATALAFLNSSTVGGSFILTTSGIAAGNLPGIGDCNNAAGQLAFTGIQI